MIELYGILNILLGVAHLLKLTVWSAVDVYRGYRKTGEVEKIGLGLIFVGLTIGIHFIEHGIHILQFNVFSMVDLLGVAIALPFPLLFLGGRIAALLGREGDVIARFSKAHVATFALLMFWVLLSFWTGAAWASVIVQYGVPTVGAGPKYILAALHALVAFLFLRHNIYSSIRYRQSSLNSVLLTGSFMTSSSSYMFTGGLSGTVFPAGHLYLVDSFGVFAVILFILFIFEKRRVT